MTDSGTVRRVCIVDDDPCIRETLRFLFEDAGYGVEEAESGDAPIALLRANPRPRVVLLDRMMPRLNGVETLRRLAEDPELTRHAATIFMTARHDPPEARHRACGTATFAVVTKPFDLDRLVATVEGAGKQLAGDTAAE